MSQVLDINREYAIAQGRKWRKKARHEHGTDIGELYWSIAKRWERHGISKTCSDCQLRCKVAGVPGEEMIDCRKKISVDKP